MIKIKAVKMSKPGVKGGSDYTWYGRITDRKILSTRELGSKIAARTIFSQAEVSGLLMAFEEVIAEELLDGNSVRLGDLGIFSLSLRSDPVDDLKKFNKKIVRELRIQFLPGKTIKTQIKSAHFSFQTQEKPK